MKYDVIKEPWIPVVMSDDGATRGMGIRELIENAHKIKKVLCDTPLENYAVQRMLIAFLMDAYSPERVLDIKRLYNTGRFDMSVIDAYIELCRNEGVTFDLFDGERPFMQARYDFRLDEGKKKPAANLFHSLPTGNNHLHFDHVPQGERSFPPDKCLRGLLATYVFAVAMVQGYPSSVNDTPCYYVLVEGKNLFETLILNMIPKRNSNCSWDSMPVAWRDVDEVTPKKEYADISTLAGMMWIPRRITLIPDENGNVSELYYQQGRSFHPNGLWVDPHVSFAVNKKEELITLKPQLARQPWRDIGAFLFSSNNRSGIPAPVIRNYPQMTQEPIVPLAIFGLITDQAKYLGWVEDSLRLPVELINDVDKAERLRFDVAYIETVGFYILAAVDRMLKASRHLGDDGKGSNSREAKNECAESALTEYLEAMHGFIFSEYMDELLTADASATDWDKEVILSVNRSVRARAGEVVEYYRDRIGNAARDFEVQNEAIRRFYTNIKKSENERTGG